MNAQNNVYDGRTAYNTSLDHVLVIFGNFEIFRIFGHPSPPATFFCEPKNAQKWDSKKVSQNRHFVGGKWGFLGFSNYGSPKCSKSACKVLEVVEDVH